MQSLLHNHLILKPQQPYYCAAMAAALYTITASFVRSDRTRKLSSIEDRGQTDHVRVEVRVKVRVDLDLQSQESYGHDPYTCKRSRSKVSQF